MQIDKMIIYEQMGFLCFAPGMPRHWPRRSQDPKGPISLALGSWRWGGGYGGGEGWGLGGEREGGGVFFTTDLCRHLSHWRFSKVCVLLIVPVG
jgi:hypothetical protein